MTITDGAIGINTATPQTLFDVSKNDSVALTIGTYSINASRVPSLNLSRSHHLATDLNGRTHDTDLLGRVNFMGNNNTGFTNGARIEAIQNGKSFKCFHLYSNRINILHLERNK